MLHYRTAECLLDPSTHVTVFKMKESDIDHIMFVFAERTQREGQAQEVKTWAGKKKTLSPVLDSSVVSHSA